MRKDHRARVIGAFLTVAVLVAGAAACDGAHTHQLTISSASGGTVSTPGEGTFSYPGGTVVPLATTPDDGYEFYSWTGDIADVAAPNLAVTTIIMNGNYAIVANFARATPGPLS